MEAIIAVGVVIGVVCGAVGAVVAVLCVVKWHARRGNPAPNPASAEYEDVKSAHLYEDVKTDHLYEDVKTAHLYEDVSFITKAAPPVTPGPQLKLTENVAYGYVETN